jgi:DNA invertase Pin-like site-specific DNA recombinase
LLEYAARAGYEVTGIWKETGSGATLDRKERSKVLALAQSRKIDAVLVTELTRWGRSTLDLLHTLQDLQSWKVSLIAQTGLQLDLTTPQGKLVAALMSALAEFERDLTIERIKSGLASAKARGKTLGRPTGRKTKATRLSTKILAMVGEGQSYRQIAKELKISKTTVNKIVSSHRKID